MRRVPPLKEGDTIGFIAPSSPAPQEALEKSIHTTESMGFRVEVGQSCHASWGYLAGPDSLRSRDIHHMFEDPSIKAVFCIRGGNGATRLPPLVDMNLLRNNPKILLGYSDVTILHLMCLQKGDFCTFHGPMPTTEFIKESFEGYVRDSLFQALTKPLPPGEILPYAGAPAMEPLCPGVAEGELTGGCLSLICALQGTPWEIDTTNKVLIFEDIHEEPYKIDRMLCTLAMGGKLRDAAAIVVGQIEEANPAQPHRSLSLEEVWENHLAGLDKPVLLNAPFGHGVKKVTLPLGAKALVDGKSGIFAVLESGVW